MLDLSKLTPTELGVYESAISQMAFSKMKQETIERAAMAAAMYASLNVEHNGGPTKFLFNYPLMTLGTYVPARGPEFEVTPKVEKIMLYAINRMVQVGKPLAILYGHDSPSEGGFLIAGEKILGDTLFGHLFGDAYLIDGIRAGLFGLSMEAVENFVDEAYAGTGEAYEIWPTAWAALPPAQIAAIPAQEDLPLGELGKIAAASGKNVVHWNFSGGPIIKGAFKPGEDADMGDVTKKEFEALESTVKGLVTSIEGFIKANKKEETPEESAALIALRKKNEETEKELKDIKAANKVTEDKETEEKIAASMKICLSRIPTGSHPDFKKRIDEKGSPAEKLAALMDIEATLPVLKDPLDKSRKFGSGHQVDLDDDENDSDADKKSKRHVKLMRAAGDLCEEEGISLPVAVAKIQKKWSKNKD